MAAAGAVCAVHTALLDFASESFNWQVGIFFVKKSPPWQMRGFSFVNGRLNPAAVDRYLMNFQGIIYIYIYSIHIYIYIYIHQKGDEAGLVTAIKPNEPFVTMVGNYPWSSPWNHQDYPSCDATRAVGTGSYGRQARYAQCSALLQAWLNLLKEAKGQVG